MKQENVNCDSSEEMVEIDNTSVVNTAPIASSTAGTDSCGSVVVDEVTDKDTKIEEIMKEIDALLNPQKKESVPDSLRARFDVLAEKGDGESKLKHLYGSVLGSNISFDETTKFILCCDKKNCEIRVNSDTVMQIKSCVAGQALHVIVGLVNGHCVAKIICLDEFYEMFHLIKNYKDKVSAMKKYMKLSLPQQQNIRFQRLGKKYPVTDGEENAHFKDRDELRLKYDMCKDTYTLQQQREIETLFSQRMFSKGKTDQKLEYILNISSVYPGRKAVHRADIIEALDKRLYKMDNVKEKIAECLVASNYTSNRGLRILLVGSPGTGKTTIARAVAEIYGIPFDVVNLNTAISAIDIKGLDSSYDGADVGKLVKSFYGLGTTEAVIVLDELDKMGTGSKDGNPADAMLDTLSDENLCYDAFLEMALDTSNTVYIATANSTQAIPDYLLNRFDVITVEDYEDVDKIVIAERYLVPQIMDMYGLAKHEIVFAADSLFTVVKHFCSDSGVRMLKENIKTIIRKVLNVWDENNHRDVTEITPDYVHAVLEKHANEDDPYLRFARNKERFSDAVRAEIKKTFETLSLAESDPREKATNLRRVEYLTALIPGEKAFDSYDKETFFESVNNSHFGLTDVKERIAKSLNARALQKKSFSSERFLLVGGAGIGKTSICKSIADGLGIPFVRISLNGVADESTIKGFAPTYVGADAGAIIKGLSRVNTTCALVQLDEIDKLGNHNGVKASNTLFDLLDNCAAFTDHYLGVPVDLSNVLFVATANDISSLEPWLLDRFNVIYLDGYTKTDKEQILVEHLLPRLEEEYAASGIKITISVDAVAMLLNDYCTSLGVRDLERAVRTIVMDKLYREPSIRCITIDADDVTYNLGAKPLPRGNLLPKNVPGFSKALAVTAGNCGMSFAIETAIIPGESSTCITGLPKESAIDSVKIAKTYIRLNYAKDCNNFGLHLHFGEGAVVKDGPSAGVAILISVLSAVFDVPVVGNVAYTGEIDLFGNIFPIGGTLAKIQAAEQSGCSHVFIPHDNFIQLRNEDLEKFSLEVIPVQHVSEVVDRVLPQVAGMQLEKISKRQ